MPSKYSADKGLLIPDKTRHKRGFQSTIYLPEEEVGGLRGPSKLSQKHHASDTVARLLGVAFSIHKDDGRIGRAILWRPDAW